MANIIAVSFEKGVSIEDYGIVHGVCVDKDMLSRIYRLGGSSRSSVIVVTALTVEGNFVVVASRRSLTLVPMSNVLWLWGQPLGHAETSDG